MENKLDEGIYVMVCPWGCSFWILIIRLSMDMQADMLWVKDFCSNICMHAYQFLPKREWHHWNVTWQQISDVGSCLWHQWCQYWRGIKGQHMRERGSMLLTLRGYRFHHTTARYLGVFWHQVCQECSTKREYLFSLQFSEIMHHKSVNLQFLWFFYLGSHPESAPTQED